MTQEYSGSISEKMSIIYANISYPTNAEVGGLLLITYMESTLPVVGCTCPELHYTKFTSNLVNRMSISSHTDMAYVSYHYYNGHQKLVGNTVSIPNIQQKTTCFGVPESRERKRSAKLNQLHISNFF